MCQEQKKYSFAFTIVELLLVLALTGILLAGMAVAFNASMTNYRQNEQIFKSISNARQALFRITTQIRTGYVDPTDISNEHECRVLCADGTELKYWYDSANNRLYLRDIDSSSDYVLCEGVTAMSFKKDNSTTSGDVKSVQISMTVQFGTVQRTLSAAAVVRKIIG